MLLFTLPSQHIRVANVNFGNPNGVSPFFLLLYVQMFQVLLWVCLQVARYIFLAPLQPVRVQLRLVSISTPLLVVCNLCFGPPKPIRVRLSL